MTRSGSTLSTMTRAPDSDADPVIRVRDLEGYRRRGAGIVMVLGTDPGRPNRAWRGRIGIVLQTCQLPAELADRDHVELTGVDLADLGALLDWAREKRLPLPGLTVERRGLEEVYLELTGGAR